MNKRSRIMRILGIVIITIGVLEATVVAALTGQTDFLGIGGGLVVLGIVVLLLARTSPSKKM
jgi:hypothetical protein